jgi:hypothetical protein
MSKAIKSNPWTDRYSNHYGTDEYFNKIEEDSLLIKELGAFASAFDPGIIIETPGNGKAQLDSSSWNWLRPLLLELAEYKRKENESI